jgi:C-terminal processing protease CtpA/Prc
MFEVTIQRNSLGLGLSIMGGPEAAAPFKHLIRVKKLFPLQPAWQTGALRPGDILLKANDTVLTGMSLRHALDVLRCSPPVTTLLVCRTLVEPELGREDEEMSPSKTSSKVFRSYSYTPATRYLQRRMTLFRILCF